MDDRIAALSLQCSTTSSRKWQLNWMVRRGRSSRVSSGDHKSLPPQHHWIDDYWKSGDTAIDWSAQSTYDSNRPRTKTCKSESSR